MQLRFAEEPEEAKKSQGGIHLMKRRLFCLIVLRCEGEAGQGRDELEAIISAIRASANWEIERVTLMEDQR
jgi:hypothetical protein